jgi:hypothetical protein
MSSNINFLKIPLYKLYYISDVNAFSGLTQEDINSLKKEYDESELEGINSAIKWALQNKDYDFSSLLPNLSHSNKDIYNYICKIHASLAKT